MGVLTNDGHIVYGANGIIGVTTLILTTKLQRYSLLVDGQHVAHSIYANHYPIKWQRPGIGKSASEVNIHYLYYYLEGVPNCV